MNEALVFTNDYCSIGIKDGILIVKYKEDIEIDLKAAKRIFADREKICNEQKYPVIADGRQVRYWTKDAKGFMASETNNRLIEAVGVLIGSYPQQIITNFYLRFYKPVVPTRFFMDYEQAYDWVYSFRN